MAWIAFGGGSVVDCAKAVKQGLVAAGHGPVGLPIGDLATTLSGAEFACSFGQTDDDTLVKGGGAAAITEVNHSAQHERGCG